jgi:hypothetical protein
MTPAQAHALLGDDRPRGRSGRKPSPSPRDGWTKITCQADLEAALGIESPPSPSPE